MAISNRMEQRVKSRARRGALKSAILQTVAIGGLVTLAVVAPNVTKALPRSLLRMIFDRSKNARNAAVGRLIKEGCLVREEVNGLRILRITPKGEIYLDRMRQRHIERPRRWDKKWRIVIFDIREKRRSTRDLLRREIRAAGFVRLQDSVWAHPFPCEDFIALLKADSHIGKDVLYLVAEEVENEQALRKYFELK